MGYQNLSHVNKTGNDWAAQNTLLHNPLYFIGHGLIRIAVRPRKQLIDSGIINKLLLDRIEIQFRTHLQHDLLRI